MRFPVFTILAASLAVGASMPPGRAASAPQASALVQAPCEEAGTHWELESCVLAAAAKSGAEVDRGFERTLRSAETFDKEFNASDAARSGSYSLAASLRTSQAAWLSHAEAQCALEGGTSGGGSGNDILEAECRYRLTAQRLAELAETDRLLNRGHRGVR
jgi:uncharacterized protein YecT (DUF1311 family)